MKFYVHTPALPDSLLQHLELLERLEPLNVLSPGEGSRASRLTTYPLPDYSVSPCHYDLRDRQPNLFRRPQINYHLVLA